MIVNDARQYAQVASISTIDTTVRNQLTPAPMQAKSSARRQVDDRLRSRQTNRARIA